MKSDSAESAYLNRMSDKRFSEVKNVEFNSLKTKLFVEKNVK